MPLSKETLAIFRSGRAAPMLVAALASVLGAGAAGAAESPVSGTDGTATGKPPALVCVPDRISVDLWWGEVAELQFSLENTGQQPLDWRLATAPAWLMVGDHGGPLAGGESCPVSVTVDAAALGRGGRGGSLVFETPGTEAAPLAAPVSASVHAPVFGARLGMVAYPVAETEVKPRPLVGLSLYPLCTGMGRAEIGLSYVPYEGDFGGPSRYTELALEWTQLIGGPRSAYWNAGGGILYEEQGTKYFTLAMIRAGGGVRFETPGPFTESYVGCTLEVPVWLSDGTLNATLAATLYYGIGF